MNMLILLFNAGWMEVIGLLVSGGGLVAILNYFLKKDQQENEQRRVDFDVILNNLLTENKFFREREGEAIKRISDLEKQLSYLQNKIILLESAHMDLPIPMWLKDTQGVMLAVNSAYEKMFLIPNGKTSQDYVGNRDVDVWGPVLGAQYWSHDQKVLYTGQTFDGFETVVLDGVEMNYRIIKYIRYAGRAKIGIAGIASPPGP